MIAYGKILAAVIAVAGVIIAQSPVNAAIKCDGNYQIIKGQGQIQTPYCSDANVAAVARQYGMRVSAEAVRQNPSVKARACRLVGDDIRVKDACSAYRPDGSRGRH